MNGSDIVRYILNPNIALRSWMLVPYAYYIKGERNAKGLTAEEFAFLTECDGRSELPDEGGKPAGPQIPGRRLHPKGRKRRRAVGLEPAAPLSEPLFPSDELDDHRQMQL